MSNHTKNLPWCNIIIDDKAILLQQKWLYTWMVMPGKGLSAWNQKEKAGFHGRAERYILASWSNKARIEVGGTSDFSKKKSGGTMPLLMDIRWVLTGQHWSVNVTKIPKSQFLTSYVDWSTNQISLDTNDFSTRNICPAVTPPACYKQTPVAHEFGHALFGDDEYPNTSPHHGDHSSIMNVGNQLRDRHFQNIINELNSMIPNTSFTVKTVG